MAVMASPAGGGGQLIRTGDVLTSAVWRGVFGFAVALLVTGCEPSYFDTCELKDSVAPGSFAGIFEWDGARGDGCEIDFFGGYLAVAAAQVNEGWYVVNPGSSPGDALDGLCEPFWYPDGEERFAEREGRFQFSDERGGNHFKFWTPSAEGDIDYGVLSCPEALFLFRKVKSTGKWCEVRYRRLPDDSPSCPDL